MGLPLTGTKYVTDTDQIRPAWDDHNWIQAADDPEAPVSTSKSFAQLGDTQTPDPAKDAILATISQEIEEAEGWLETFCVGIYALPLNPVDRFVCTLVADYAVYRFKCKRDMYRTADDQKNALNALINQGNYIRNKNIRLNAAPVPVGADNLNELVFGFGGDDKRDDGSNGPMTGPRLRPGAWIKI